MNEYVKQSRRDVLAFLGSAATLALVPEKLSARQGGERPEIQEYPYTVVAEPWPYFLGNHRVQVFSDQASEAVCAHIPWRRVDSDPDQKAVLVFDRTGREIVNVVTPNVTQEFGDVIFKAEQPGIYFIYYLPHEELKGPRSVLGPKGRYRKPQQRGETSWIKLHNTSSKQWLDSLPKARVIEFQARTAFDSFYPMLVPAADSEVRKLCERYSQYVLLFPEDREHPIKMADRLPLRWIQNGPGNTYTGVALRGEFYVLQIGVYLREDAPSPNLPLRLRFDNLTGPNGETLPASAWNCLNTDIIDVHGESTHYEMQVGRGKVTSLWCGVQVPLQAKHGMYRGNISVVVNNEVFPVRIDLEIKRDFIRAGGVDQGWRLARIGWLNSKIGLDDSITSPYSPLQSQGDTVTCLGKEIRLGEDGFPKSIRSNGCELLAAPVAFTLDGSRLRWQSTSIVESKSDAKIVVASVSESGPFTLQVRTTVEFDGGIGFDVKLTSKQFQAVADIALEIPYLKDMVPYAVGMGLTGGRRPRSLRWSWSEQPQSWKDQGSNLEYFLWLGDVVSGLYCRLKSPLENWKNGKNGFVSVAESGDSVLFKASSGAKRIHANEKLDFSFRLLPTPVKPIDSQHWRNRYAHSYQPPSELRAMGATINNIHQGTLPNMYINYPFLNLDLLVPYTSEAHTLGMKVKIYYTMRELSTRLPELWTFRSLGNEIYRVGGTQGQGDPQLDFWLQEHLRDDYSPGWITPTPTGDIDTSLRVYSDSRLANFYLEGLNWLLQNAAIDGLYLDEIGYPRVTMQRVRRILERRPGAMIDMHGNHDWWSCHCPIGYYMEHLPYIDRLWLGEGFDPDSPPDFWLIEMSGIPFGLSSDMLEKPNLWRGMLFGMTDRALYSGPSPTPIWKLWDSFGIEDAEMIGWWNKDVPVKTGRSDVLVTVYKKPGKSLIALASWASGTVSVTLDVNWEALGIAANKTKITIPEMEGIQAAGQLRSGQPIRVHSGRGFLLIFEQI